jgi:hypothetical protein
MTEEIITNPISTIIKNSVNRTRNRILFAVPYMTNFALEIFNSDNTVNLLERKCIIRFDESNLLTFDIPTIQKLLDYGFEIRFDNNIHLKLYITDLEVFVSSSNLTKSGFENNVELTVKVEQENISNCFEVFNTIWISAATNKITNEILKENLAKYYLLKRLSRETNNIYLSIKEEKNLIINEDFEKIINLVLARERNYNSRMKLAFEAKQVRKNKLAVLNNGFRTEIFYVNQNHLNRNDTLYYDFIYGIESRLAGTGLREEHFIDICNHPEFQQVIEYIMPEIIGLKKWNFYDKNELLKFCIGLFDFNIKSYKEAFPIRLASYFYPEFFLPIFKLEHLQRNCSYFGFESKSKNEGQRLFDYNTILFSKLENLSYDTDIKSDILYLIHYTIELNQKLQNGEDYKTIKNSYPKKWEREYTEEAFKILKLAE